MGRGVFVTQLVEVETEVEVNLLDLGLSASAWTDLITQLIQSDVPIPMWSPPKALCEAVETRHYREHPGPLVTCTDPICDQTVVASR